MNTSGSLEIFLYSLLLGVLSVGLYFSYFSSDYFNKVFASEDGIIETTTAILLFCSSLLLTKRFIYLRKGKKSFWKVGILIFAILFLFASGEEISWGQRIFHISSGDFFLEKNLQKETNLHNLNIGDINLNRLIFGKLITIFLLIYLLILPVLYKRLRMVNRFVDKFAIPVVKWHHSTAFIVSTFVILIISPDRKWELYEFCFALIFLVIFLNPLNYHIYKKSRQSDT